MAITVFHDKKFSYLYSKKKLVSAKPGQETHMLLILEFSGTSRFVLLDVAFGGR